MQNTKSKSVRIADYFRAIEAKQVEKGNGMRTIIMDDVDAVKADIEREHAKQRPELIAGAFSRVLRQWLTPLQMAKVITRNRRELHAGVCHSHDFCDANMAMDEAFKVVLGRGMLLIEDGASDEDKEADTDLWNAAWDIAKKRDFYP